MVRGVWAMLRRMPRQFRRSAGILPLEAGTSAKFDSKVISVDERAGGRTAMCASVARGDERAAEAISRAKPGA